MPGNVLALGVLVELRRASRERLVVLRRKLCLMSQGRLARAIRRAEIQTPAGPAAHLDSHLPRVGELRDGGERHHVHVRIQRRVDDVLGRVAVDDDVRRVQSPDDLPLDWQHLFL